MTGLFASLMAQRFGPEWDKLTPAQRALVINDFAELVTEYDTDSLNGPDMGGVEFDDNALDASREYRRRIGGGNLLSYVKCLEVNARRK